jgi:hypothetical protein
VLPELVHQHQVRRQPAATTAGRGRHPVPLTDRQPHALVAVDPRYVVQLRGQVRHASAMLTTPSHASSPIDRFCAVPITSPARSRFSGGPLCDRNPMSSPNPTPSTRVARQSAPCICWIVANNDQREDTYEDFRP